MQNIVDVRTLTMEQKKALAYDLIAQLEQTQKNLTTVNMAIQEEAQQKEKQGKEAKKK